MQETIKQNDAPVTLDLSLVKNKKDVIDSVWSEHDNLKITEEQLTTWHESIDQNYLVKSNHSVLKILHNTIYPTGKTTTKTNQRLYHIVDTTEIRKMLLGENNGDEHEWKDSLWKIPTIQVWSKLLFKFEVFTDMINDEATMGLICNNFKKVPVFWNFFQVNVRQTMIQSLASNRQDKDT